MQYILYELYCVLIISIDPNCQGWTACDLADYSIATLRYLNLQRNISCFFCHCSAVRQIKITWHVQWSACRSECSLFLTMSASWKEKQWPPHITVLNRTWKWTYSFSISYVFCGSVREHKVLWIKQTNKYSQVWSIDSEIRKPLTLTNVLVVVFISSPN